MNTFDLVIYAIVAIALIFVLFTVFNFINTPESNTKLIAQSIELAQTETKLGQTVNLGQLYYTNNQTIDKVDLAKEFPIISFDCLSPTHCCIKKKDQGKDYVCDKAVTWNDTYFMINTSGKLNTSTRCIRVDGTSVCKVYLGGLPAQAKIEEIEVLDTKTGTGEIKANVKNIGAQTLAIGKMTLTLYKKSANNWIETDYVSDAKEINSISAGEKSFFLWSINPNNSGDYKALFKFEGQNGGFDEKSVEFLLDKTNTCIESTTTPLETIFDPETESYQEVHTCENCAYSIDCASALAKKTGKLFYPLNETNAYCYKQTMEGTC